MIKLTNDSTFMAFCKDNMFFKVEERENTGNEKSLSELHCVGGGDMRLATVMRTAWRIEYHPECGVWPSRDAAHAA